MGKKRQKNRKPRYDFDTLGFPPLRLKPNGNLNVEITLGLDQPQNLQTTDTDQGLALAVADLSHQVSEHELEQSYKPKMEDDGMLEAKQLMEQLNLSNENSADESLQALAENNRPALEAAAYEAEIKAIAKSKLPFYRLNPTLEEIGAVRQAEMKQDALMNYALDARKADQNQQLGALKESQPLPTLKADGSVEYLNSLLNSLPSDSYTALNVAMGSLERVGVRKADVPKKPAKGVKPQAFAKANEYNGSPVTPYQQLLADKQRKAELEKLLTKEGNSHHETYKKLQRDALLDTVVDKVPLLSEAVDQAHRDQVAKRISKPGI